MNIGHSTVSVDELRVRDARWRKRKRKRKKKRRRKSKRERERIMTEKISYTFVETL